MYTFPQASIPSKVPIVINDVLVAFISVVGDAAVVIVKIAGLLTAFIQHVSLAVAVARLQHSAIAGMA